MCGINGILRLADDAPRIELAELRRCRDVMAARGPDGAGEWLSSDGRCALAHRRLAILDLAPRAAQPMSGAGGRFRLVFNGEIYNFRALRAELERGGHRFATESDTEVLLALWEREGERALARLRGMYAFALWDAREECLSLVRDPFGIKPLYYSLERQTLRFASQVRALEAAGISAEIDPAGLAGFLLWGSVPEPWTIRRAVRALPAGHLLRIRPGARLEGPEPFAPPPPDLESPSPEAPPLGVEAALAASVGAHLVSDVPVALFLSAGLDSALVAALAARELGERLSTFTLAFEGWQGSARDEAPLAREVARVLGSRHVERRLGRDEVAAAWLPALDAMDQPSIDGFNTFLVARAAHEAGIQVALSGLGGDELLGGYPSFRDVPSWNRWARTLGSVPGATRIWPSLTRTVTRTLGRTFARTLGTLAPARPKLPGLLEYGTTLAGAYYLRRGLFLPEELPALIGRDRTAAALAELHPVIQAQRVLDQLTHPHHPSHDPDSDSALDRNHALAPNNAPNTQRPPQTPHPPFYGSFASSFSSFSSDSVSSGAATDWDRVQLLEATLYLRNQLLRDSDWAAMAHSVELRVPLVDPILWSQLARHRHEPARSRGKAALVRAVAPELPAALWSRPKSGFVVPVAEWLCPPRPGERDTAGKGSRRLALRILEETGLCAR